MPDMDLKKIILVAAFIAVAVVVFLVKEAINKKKGGERRGSGQGAPGH